MSGDRLPITGRHAVVMLSILGLGPVAVPIPVMIAIVGVTVVLVGALLVRAGFRRSAPLS